MTSMVFVNLPVVNVATAKDFYTAIGFTNNPQFTEAHVDGYVGRTGTVMR
jgi:predicted lactoylglutathione lyase